MATRPLDHTGEQPPDIDKGHGTGALGPSDDEDLALAGVESIADEDGETGEGPDDVGDASRAGGRGRGRH